jgi:hypothetical protein
MTITESRPSEQIVINLEFIEPFESNPTTTFDFKPEGAGTLVTWTMSGTNNFMGKAFDLFLGMEKQVGPDFEEGLRNLKSVAEAQQGKAKSKRRIRRLLEERVEYLVKT